MALSNKPQFELVAILNAGAALELSVNGKPQFELVALATAARTAGTHLTLSGVAMKPQFELVAIATAGKGHVTLRD